MNPDFHIFLQSGISYQINEKLKVLFLSHQAVNVMSQLIQ